MVKKVAMKRAAKSAARKSDEKEARIKIIRYIAFTDIFDYDRVADFSTMCGFLRKDATSCSEYYLIKEWLTGSPIRNTFYTEDECQLDTMHRCGIIANTPIDEMADILDKAEDVRKNSWTYYLDENNQNGLNEDFCTLTRSFNAYCRAFPDTLSAFTDMDDFPCEKPDDYENGVAKEMWAECAKELSSQNLFVDDLSFLCPLFNNPAFRDFYLSLPPTIFLPLFEKVSIRHLNLEKLSQEDYDYLMGMTVHKPMAETTYLDEMADNIMFYNHFLQHGDIEWHKQRMHEGTQGMVLLCAIEALQNGQPDKAFKMLEDPLKKLKMDIVQEPLYNFIYGLAILQSDSAASQKKAETLAKKKAIKENDTIPFFRLLIQMKAHPETDFGKWIAENLYCTYSTKLGAAFTALLCVHYGYTKSYNTPAKNFGEILIKEGFKVLALDFAKDIKDYRHHLDQLEADTKMMPLLPEFKLKEPWEIVIDTMLMKFEGGKTVSTKKTASNEEISRVSYLLNTRNNNVQPRLQKSKNGGVTWSSGRNIALKNFQKGLPEMTQQDTRIALLVETYSCGWYGGTEVSLGGAKVIEALIGHPLVFDVDNHDLKIEIQSEKLQIQVKEVTNGYKVSTNVKQNSNGTYDTISVHQENVQLIKVVHLSNEEKEMLTLLDRIKVFPKDSKAKLTQLLSTLGKKVTVMSPLLKNAENVKQKKGDAKLTIQLVPYGDQFTARCFVKPLVTCPPYCTPGKGLEFIAANVKGETIQVARNLTAERKNLKEFTEWMEPFDEYENEGGWQMPIESCLELLDLLRQHTDICIIEWPEGVKFSVNHPALKSNAISLNIKGIGHWFEVDGEVKIGDKQKMKVNELLQRVRESKGRFIQIGDAEYIALSQQLKKQLSALDRLMLTDHKQLKIATYNSSFLQDMAVSGANLKTDNSYTEMLAKMDEADTMKISVPKTLQADLRDYQKDGYRWLCRLAHWGAGACLADDMGLGKTLQTIALLLARAKDGASLVVMPTSVLINWKNELTRFAPSLNPIILRDESDRSEALNNAGAQDVVLITYGLLPTEEEALTKKQWNVIVLDEAHTIKNKETKTSKVAMQLDGKFRLLLTGTPLQNHLSEIWNLFQFATPGLLTGYTQFTKEFINPIEKEHNKEPQRLLKRMLQPFILRRTKSEVLNELPEKTEITLKVELSEAERALYDRFREEAVLNLEDGSTSAIKALAELTKLRQTACNSALVLPAKEAKDIPSSKMEAFLKLVDELMRNHHRALVFSQFTSHLALVEKELMKLKIQYQYLDGSVSPTERLTRVAEFQKGDMPLFLISLKAGGTGLNLTAADYVIHLDPWWNPAIEDQASDRAYRIGQDKPVTVYRLIAENTIEEKIIACPQARLRPCNYRFLTETLPK